MIENTLRPTIRILHTLARSGGTVVGKCLGSMDGVVLLSEIHPAVIADLSLIEQANKWYHLFSPEDIQWLMQKGTIEFREAVAMINERCTEQGKTLVIRDWSYIDFIGVPYRSQPCFSLKTADVLKKQFSIAHTSLVRHPIDQWLSLKGLVRMENVTLEMFLQGYFRFAEYCADIGFTRYEDFTRDPEKQLRILCDRLDLNFDPGFKNRWANYSNITGDIYGAGRGGNEIKPLPRREMEPGLLEMFKENNDYLRSIELLGYEHPELNEITDLLLDRQDRYAIP